MSRPLFFRSTRPARPFGLLTLLAIFTLGFTVSGCRDSVPEAPPDEAAAAGKTAADLPAASVDYAAGMDDGITLTPEEIEGRNSWMVWSGGNERFWNHMAQEGYGLIDFLKLVDSRERGTRFARLGLMNEPGYTANPAPDEFGLYLDKPIPGEARGGLDPTLYGTSPGILGLRLFPNPAFDAAARARWDAKRFYTDVAYATNPKLIRPYRVGMTCAICHVAPNPALPPADPENPTWANLSGTIGNQYFKNGAVFGFNLRADDFLGQLLRSAPPGTVDTSIMSTDYNNNPNIINGIFNTAERLRIARSEHVSGGALLLSPHAATRPVPHVLVDGADTIGVVGALSRVYINIGTYSEEWLRCQNPILGGRPSRPMRIQEALTHSAYYAATVEQMPNLARYLVRAGRPIPLAEAPGGAAYLTESPAMLERGKLVFAENCFACHSSKQPADGIERPIEKVNQWSQDPEYLAFARAEVLKSDFLDQNYLSIDQRVPVTVVKTNSARALQDNATTGRIWAEFSSDDYKATPSPGVIKIQDPFTGVERDFKIPGGGPGFYRVPSLVALWTSAPYFHNNGLGLYNHDPSVPGRMAAFDDAIRKLMWPERRDGLGSIAVATERSWLRFPAAFLPVAVRGVLPCSAVFLDHPWILPLKIALGGACLLVWSRRPTRGPRLRRFGQPIACLLLLGAIIAGFANFFAAGRLGDVEIGPIPKGTPLNLMVNLDPDLTPPLKALDALWTLDRTLAEIRSHDLDDAAALKLIQEKAAPKLLAVNKAPDFVRDRGHYFPAPLSDEEKEALIAFLKRM